MKKKRKNKIIISLIVLAVLVFAFLQGDAALGLRERILHPKDSVKIVRSIESTKEEKTEQEQEVSEISVEEADKPAKEENKPENIGETPVNVQEKTAESEIIAEKRNEDYSNNIEKEANDAETKEKNHTDSDSEEKPVPIESQDAVISNEALTCTLAVRCNSVLDNMSKLNAEKAEIIPKDGIIYAEQTVTFYEGESVFDLLLREMKRNKIHMEYVNTPAYNSAYIEGIANLYEFDCGGISGWRYKVNGSFPDYGCSYYQLKEGDKVEWIYTCDLGEDVGAVIRR